jgi:DNA-binding IclR family transcriptional regulator
VSKTGKRAPITRDPAHGGGRQPTGGNVRAVDRSLEILRAFIAAGPELSLDSISEHVDLPKSTTHRLLQSLIGGGFVQQAGRPGSYRLSALVAELGATAARGRSREFIHDALVGLRDRTGETVGLEVLERTSSIVLDRVESLEPLRYQIHAGSRLPAHASTGGKVLLAALSAGAVREIFATETLPSYTPKTLTNVDALLSELERVQRQGYAIDDEEFRPGLRCVAVPVVVHGTTSHALGVGGAVTRLTLAVIADLLPILEETAAAITAYLEADGPPPDTRLTSAKSPE